MSTYNIIAASNESTVVAEYTPESALSDSFQSEAALEKEFIRLLTTQGYAPGFTLRRWQQSQKEAGHH